MVSEQSSTSKRRKRLERTADQRLLPMQTHIMFLQPHTTEPARNADNLNVQAALKYGLLREHINIIRTSAKIELERSSAETKGCDDKAKAAEKPEYDCRAL